MKYEWEKHFCFKYVSLQTTLATDTHLTEQILIEVTMLNKDKSEIGSRDSKTNSFKKRKDIIQLNSVQCPYYSVCQ
jgi:hypothetical protein